jgi:hypothetical protein
MYLERKIFYTFIIISFFLANSGFSQSLSPEEDDDKNFLELGINLLERYFSKDTTWHVINEKTGESVIGMIRFIEKQPVDSILKTLNIALKDTDRIFVYRIPENVSDSLEVPGYYPYKNVSQDIHNIRNRLEKKFLEDGISVPLHLITGIEEMAGVIPYEEGEKLFDNNVYVLPDSLKVFEVIPDSLIHSAEDFKRFQKLDSLRDNYIEQKRQAYNDSIVEAYRDSVVASYRQEMFEQRFNFEKNRIIDSVRLNNYRVLKNYNDSVVMAVNDSIWSVVDKLAEYADFIDTTRIYMTNLVGDESSILLQNGNQYFSMVRLKNEQNDSLRIAIKNLDKKTIQMLIADGVTFSRFKPKQTKEFDFSSLSRTMAGLTGVGEKYQVLTPWRIGGDGTVGFTQTYLENWKKGGESAISLSLVLKGFANYSSYNGNVKWENSGEIRNGWIRPGGKGAELQKNDDKFELTSRFGLSAFKKWYYSSEFDYETQFFNGYKYPTSANPNPISAFMSPARTYFKIGLDYKPHNRFSLFLSPLTIKNVFVKDTVKIDQTNFGIDAGKRGFWEMGLNADLKYSKEIFTDVTYETKYKMFINYQEPFQDLDINWENLLVMPLTDHINLRMMLHLIYDDDVLFPVYNPSGEQIGEEPKLQVREFITVGFSYKINRQVTRTRKKTNN